MLAAALPILFLHVRYQPGFTVSAGSTSVHVVLSDLAVLASRRSALWVVATRPRLRWARAAGSGSPRRRSCCGTSAAVIYPRWLDETYDSHTHFVTAAKFAEYALLAPAVVVLVRRRADLDLLLGVLVAWSVRGEPRRGDPVLRRAHPRRLADRAGGSRRSWDTTTSQGCPARRRSVALAAGSRCRGRRGRFAAVAAVSGVVGLILSGSTAGAIGFALAARAASRFGKWRSRATRRRLAAIVASRSSSSPGSSRCAAATSATCSATSGSARRRSSTNVETLVQRTLLIYIGWREFLHHPVTGSGFESSLEESVYSPYLPAARAKFPGSPPRAFPSPEHPWGVQNLYVQTLAETGRDRLPAPGRRLRRGLWTAGRAALRGPPEVAAPRRSSGYSSASASGTRSARSPASRWTR